METGGFLVSRTAALLSPWRSVLSPVYETARNIVMATFGYVQELTAGLRHRAGGKSAVRRTLGKGGGHRSGREGQGDGGGMGRVGGPPGLRGA